MNQNTKRPNCRQCEYFFVTWIKTQPYGCKAFGFKGRKIPSQSVYEASGTECLKFAQKKKSSR